ncbi:hypothetical protein KIW84_043690 [Lathyrus oleraceus]|uniref:BHLH domain-containing protein n=1 Tax=Pisum sativum TaxID=3888 RepID=A0A9D5AUW5_PEA|nr:hypothetical protein KIW84_043690 [Pisum sativum]
MVPHECLNQPVEISPISKVKSQGYNKTLSFHYGNGEEDKEESAKEPQKEMYHAKNLITERNRRNRIKKGLFILRSLVPNITKMDRAAILDDAIEYIKELQRQKIELQEKVDVLDVEDCKKNTLQMSVQGDKEQPLSELNQSSSYSIRKTEMELQVEVNHVGETSLMIKLCCEMKRGNSPGYSLDKTQRVFDTANKLMIDKAVKKFGKMVA